MPQYFDQLKVHYGLIKSLFSSYQNNLSTKQAEFAAAKTILQKQIDTGSNLSDHYRFMYQDHQDALEKLKKATPNSSQFLFVIRSLFRSKTSLFSEQMQHSTQVTNVERIVDANSKALPLLNLWQAHSKDLRIFEQNALTEKYQESLSQQGVCDGLISEWVRFHSKYPHGQEDFLEKLHNKYENPDNSVNFVARIQGLQKNQEVHKRENKDFYFMTQESIFSSAPKNASKCASEEEIISKTINYLNENKNNNVVALDVAPVHLNRGGHAIGIRCVRDSEQEIQAYVLYDPNMGEVSFRGDNKEQALQEFFVEWTKGLASAMAEGDMTHYPQPLLKIILETSATAARIQLLDEKKQQQLHKAPETTANNTVAAKEESSPDIGIEAETPDEDHELARGMKM